MLATGVKTLYRVFMGPNGELNKDVFNMLISSYAYMLLICCISMQHMSIMLVPYRRYDQ